jgi:hypothetical protein
MKSSGNAQNNKESVEEKAHFQKCAMLRRRRKPTLLANLGHSSPWMWPSPSSNRPERGSGEQGQPACGRTLGVPAPPYASWAHLAQAVQ